MQKLMRSWVNTFSSALFPNHSARYVCQALPKSSFFCGDIIGGGGGTCEKRAVLYAKCCVGRFCPPRGLTTRERQQEAPTWATLCGRVESNPQHLQAQPVLDPCSCFLEHAWVPVGVPHETMELSSARLRASILVHQRNQHDVAAQNGLRRSNNAR